MEAGLMSGRTGFLAFILILAQAAHAQDAPRVIRQIAPDRFQPNPRGDSEPRAAAAAVPPPSKENPFGGCDRASRNWLNCLRATADLSTLMVAEAENRLVASLDQRPNLSPSLQRILAKDLSDADSKWLELRKQECSQLALLEVGSGKQLYEAQMLCQITHNTERIGELAAHYGGTASNAVVSPPAH
jgi:hypothetical protein